MSLLSSFKKRLLLASIRRKHLQRNKHNFTTIKNGNKSNNIIIGNNTYGDLNYIDYHDGCKLIIGDNCSIAANVVFLMGGEHKYDTFSTFPFESIFKEKITSFNKGDIVIENDVWIGYGATILSGVKIGVGSIIGACSLVTKDVPPYSIVGGVPAVVIKKRFSDEVIRKLLTVQIKINKNNYSLYEKIMKREISESNVDEIIKELSNL